jgi:hypothetical protein
MTLLPCATKPLNVPSLSFGTSAAAAACSEKSNATGKPIFRSLRVVKILDHSSTMTTNSHYRQRGDRRKLLSGLLFEDYLNVGK